MASSSGIFEVFATIWSMMCMAWAVVWIAAVAVGLFFFVVWILMLIDCIKRKFAKENEQLLWLLIILLTGVIGAIIYYFLVKRPDKH